ncbi:hypothetical protein NDU88_011688 [Pleurodeles waltl]|uniref:Uncharacterized protein n=1 Tax=Pleurodeles waltl TaxID=8319 RepID=A0AAV7QY03_PLEWA|nr:hypothetical protein NDU88_011688 [Pleurodeles waltl]
MQLSKQAQSPRESGAERPSAISDEGTLGGTFKMAVPSMMAFPVEGRLEVGLLNTTVKMAARRYFIEDDVIIISDEEMERQNSHRVVRNEENLQSAGLPGEMVSKSVRRMPSLDGSMCHEVRAGNLGSQSVFKVGEQLEFIDKAGVVIRGIVCGETSGDGSIERFTRQRGSRLCLDHGADSVFDEQPSTSRGASARFECPDEEWLDYKEDVEEQVIPAPKSIVRETTHSVPKVVRGDPFGNRHRDVAAGSLPRGCVGGPDGACAVWIVGHSFVRWAEKMAALRHFGRQLSLDGTRIKVSWVGKSGMR